MTDMTHAPRVLRLLLAGLAVALFSASAGAQEFSPSQRAEIVRILRDALKQDPTILRDAITAMQTRASDDQRAALTAAKDSLVDPADPVGGNPQGDVTIVEFFDTRCPYCRKLEPTMADLLARDHGVRLVYKDLPILGPASLLGARALLAAQRQGGYEKLRSAIMAAPPQTNKELIEHAAQQLGLDWQRLEHDMGDPAIQGRIEANLRLAHAIGIDGTPALVIGGELIPGAVEIADLTETIAKARKARQTSR
jgi:protein-disulfide isomerase